MGDAEAERKGIAIWRRMRTKEGRKGAQRVEVVEVSVVGGPTCSVG